MVSPKQSSFLFFLFFIGISMNRTFLLNTEQIYPYMLYEIAAHHYSEEIG